MLALDPQDMHDDMCKMLKRCPMGNHACNHHSLLLVTTGIDIIIWYSVFRMMLMMMMVLSLVTYRLIVLTIAL